MTKVIKNGTIVTADLTYMADVLTVMTGSCMALGGAVVQVTGIVG